MNSEQETLRAGEVIEDKFPIRKDSIEELVGHRNRTIELARQGYMLLDEANKASQLATPFIAGGGIGTRHEVAGHCAYEVDECVQQVITHVDRNAWRSLLRHSGLRNLMDATAHKQFNDQLDKSPPAFTVENITATFMTMVADAPNILERSVVTVFDKLTHRRTHKTNSAFGIGPKIILTGAVSFYGWNSYGYTREMVSDMDRLFHVLDGKKPPEGGNVADLISEATRHKRATVTSEYFRCKLFKNGNLHMQMLREDLVDRVNHMLTKHKGITLPDDRMPNR